MRMVSAGMTHAGLVRQNNEDSFCLEQDIGLFVVADGMGGAASGEVASRTAVEVIREYITAEKRDISQDAGALHRLISAIGLANTEIYAASLKNPSMTGMGTTVAAVIIDNRLMSVAHVGDSRVYLIRCGVITALTEDHSFVAEQVRAGHLTSEEAEVSGMRNIITRALGSEDEVEIDTGKIAVMAGDIVILCSDGLTTMVPNEEVLSVVLSGRGPSDICKSLVDTANRYGGKDNITVVVVMIRKHGLKEIIQDFLGL